MVKNVAEEVLTVEKCLIKILHWWFLYQHVRKQVHHFSVHPFLTFSVSNSCCTSLFRSVSVAFLNCPPIPTPTSKGFSVVSTKLFHIIWSISLGPWYGPHRKKLRVRESPDFSSYSSKWNNLPYTSNLNVWWILFTKYHLVSFQVILNSQSVWEGLSINSSPAAWG